MSERDVGDLGESTLRTWAAQVGIVANKAKKDKTGWDFILEFPHEHGRPAFGHLPLDIVPPPIQCLVQVKSTDDRRGYWPVKLSNWQRLVNSSLPAFFLVFEFGGSNGCQDAYLVHIDKEYISQVLKRLRQMPEKRRAKLHKHTLRFQYGSKDRLPSLDGAGLERAIRHHIGEGAGVYAAKKLGLLDTVGYEDGRWQVDMKLTFPEGVDAEEYLVDFMLGLVRQIEPTELTIWEKRFGIPAPEPIERLGPGGIVEVIPKPFAKGTIIFTYQGRPMSLRLDFLVHIPQGLGFEIDKRNFKIRFAGPFYNFVFAPNRDKRVGFEIRWPEVEKKYRLHDLAPLAELLLFQHEIALKKIEAQYEARVDSKLLAGGRIQPGPPWDTPELDYAIAINSAWVIAKHFDIQDQVELELSELWGQRERLQYVAAVLGRKQPPAMVISWGRYEPPSIDKTTCVPVITEIGLGQYYIVFAFALMGKSKATGQVNGESMEFQTNIDHTEIRWAYYGAWGEKPGFTAKSLINDMVQAYDDTVQVLITDKYSGPLMFDEMEPPSAQK